MVCRAEERFAEEIDASGEFQHGGDHGNQHTGGKAQEAGLGDIGISSQRVSDFRKVRDLGGEKVGEIIDKAVSEGRAPTKAEVLSHHSKAVNPFVNPNPPEGFARRIHMAGYIKELSSYCQKYEASFIANACAGNEKDDMLKHLDIITDWKRRFENES